MCVQISASMWADVPSRSHALKRGYTYSPPQATDTPMRPSTQKSDSYTHEDSYTYGPPSIKRQKSDAEYSNNPHMYPPSTLNTSANSAYEDRRKMWNNMPNLYTQSGSNMPMNYPMSGGSFSGQSSSTWPAQGSHGSISGASSGYNFSSTPGMYSSSYQYPMSGRPSTGSISGRGDANYQSQISSQTPYRNPSDGYVGATGLVTPTSVPDSIGQGPNANYLQSSGDSKTGTGGHNATQGQAHSQQYQQSPLLHYGTDAASLGAGQHYATSLSSPAGLPSHYNQPQEASIPRTQQAYTETGQYQASGPMSHSSVPAMSLNTDMAGSYYGQQAAYGEDGALEQSAYPTPGGPKSWAS